MIAALTFVLVLSVLVLVHELGHFVVARRAGVTVHEFGFGFPPRLFGVRRGSTLYSVNLIPFGGFVKLAGEGDGESGPGTFRSARMGWRVGVLLAGVGMNLLTAIVAFTVAGTIGVPTAIDPTNVPSTARDVHVTIAEVLPGSPAERAGVRVTDRIVSLNGAPVRSVDDIREGVRRTPDSAQVLVVRRGSTELSTAITPDRSAGEPRLGIAGVSVATVSEPFPRSLGTALRTTGSGVRAVLAALGTLVRDLVVSQRVSPDVTGPIGIAVITGQVAAIGFAAVLQFLGSLSISLAVLNVLPLPALDGGRLLFTAIEAVRGRPISGTVENAIHAVGFYALLAVALVVSIKDFRQFHLFQTLSGVLR